MTPGPAVPLPEVTVVIPVRDDVSGLARCLDHLARQTYPAELVEVLVCDNGSDPPLRVEDLGLPEGGGMSVRVLSEPIAGSYRARNRCLEVASGDVLAFTDADCSPDPDWLRCGVEALGERQMALAAGHVRVYSDRPRPSSVEVYEMVTAFPQRRYVERMSFGVTANLFVTADVFDRVGPFDENLTSGGDREFCTRAVAAGASLRFVPQSVVAHPARATLRDVRAKAARVRRGRYEEFGASPDKRQIVRRLVPPVGAVRRSRAVGTDHRLRARYVLGEMLSHYAVVSVEVPYLWRKQASIVEAGGRA